MTICRVSILPSIFNLFRFISPINPIEQSATKMTFVIGCLMQYAFYNEPRQGFIDSYLILKRFVICVLTVLSGAFYLRFILKSFNVLCNSRSQMLNTSFNIHYLLALIENAINFCARNIDWWKIRDNVSDMYHFTLYAILFKNYKNKYIYCKYNNVM